MEFVPMHEIISTYNPGPGRHWFDADTMRFFRSRLPDGGYKSADGRIYFVTSEKNSSQRYSFPRLYSVRCFFNGDVKTIGEFQAFKTSATAHRYAKGYASGNIALPEVSK